MSIVLALPLPVEALPESLRRFGDPAAPERARTIAARGLVPDLRERLRGARVVSAAAGELVAACRDPNDGIRAMAALLPLLVRSSTVERADASSALGCRAEDLDHVLDGLSFRVEKETTGRSWARA